MDYPTNEVGIFTPFTINGAPAVTKFQMIQNGEAVTTVNVAKEGKALSASFTVELALYCPKGGKSSRKLQVEAYTLNAYSHFISDEGPSRAAQSTMIMPEDSGTIVAQPEFSLALSPYEETTASLIGLDTFFLTQSLKDGKWSYSPIFRTIVPLNWGAGNDA